MRTYEVSEYGIGRVDTVEAETATKALWAAVDRVDEQDTPDGVIRLLAYWSDGEHESDFAEGMFERNEAGEWEWSRVAWRLAYRHTKEEGGIDLVSSSRMSKLRTKPEPGIWR